MASLEFLIDEIKQDGDSVRVFGVVNEGCVSLNSGFCSIRSPSGVSAVVSFKVSGITAYHRQIGQLPRGMGGELLMSGVGLDRLEPNFMLTN